MARLLAAPHIFLHAGLGCAGSAVCDRSVSCSLIFASSAADMPAFFCASCKAKTLAFTSAIFAAISSNSLLMFRSFLRGLPGYFIQLVQRAHNPGYFIGPHAAFKKLLNTLQSAV